MAGAFSVFHPDGTAHPFNDGRPHYYPRSRKVIGIVNVAVVVRGTKEAALTYPIGISHAIVAGPRSLREVLDHAPQP